MQQSSVWSPEMDTSGVSTLQRAKAFLALSKPNLTALVALTSVLGFYLATPLGAHFDWVKLLYLIQGTFLTSAGACAYNMFAERDLDSQMHRTRHRPIPQGLVSPDEAFVFSVLVFSVGFVDLLVFCGTYPALLSLGTALLYCFWYTPMKAKGPVSIWIGAIPGAIPPVIGWTSVRPTVGIEGLLLFTILFVWQFPHFLSLAFIHRKDYARAGFRFLPQNDPHGERTGLLVFIGVIMLVPLTLLLAKTGLTGPVYFGGAILLGTAFTIIAFRMAWSCSIERAKHTFLMSVFYLPGLLALLFLDRA